MKTLTTNAIAKKYNQSIQYVNGLVKDLDTKTYKHLGIIKWYGGYILGADAQLFIICLFEGDDAVDFKVDFIMEYNRRFDIVT